MAKRCTIGPRLLLITNRKSHTDFEIRYKSLTLDDLEGLQCTMVSQSCGIAGEH